MDFVAGVIPDHEFGSILKKIFGPDAHAFRKYRRMMYWLPKFKNANPYPVPKVLPEDPCLLAALALKRMAIDKENVIDMWKVPKDRNTARHNTTCLFKIQTQTAIPTISVTSSQPNQTS